MSNMNKGSNILDTLLFDSNSFVFKDLHAARTFEAYQQVNTPVLLNEVLQCYNHLEKQLMDLKTPQKVVRLLFSMKDFKVEMSMLDCQPLPAPQKLQVLKSLKCNSGVGLTNYKWEQRDFWTSALSRKAEGADDVISVNDKNNLVETSRYNLFLFKNTTIYTPPLDSGCIHGVYRRWALQRKQMELPGLGTFPLEEKNIHVDDVTGYQLFAANSVRGVLSSVLFST